MTGVPRSKGCNACRKQKKRCDQLQPACTRCARLGLVCVGAGEKRYKFVHASETQPDERGISTWDDYNPGDPLAVVPASPTTRVAGVFISRLEVQDVRYDISAFGRFLQLLPQRTHSNEALETAMDAFSAAFSYDHYQGYSIDWLRKYNRAIKALRDHLNTPAKAKTVETLCAIYLLLLAQAWSPQQHGEIVRHEEGLLHVLELLVHKGVESEFEAQVFVGVSAALVHGGMRNPKICLTPIIQETVVKIIAQRSARSPPSESRDVKSNDSASPRIHRTKNEPTNRPKGIGTLQFSNAVMLPKFLQEPELYYQEMLSMLPQAQADIALLQQVLDSLTLDTCPRHSARERLRRDCQSLYAKVAAVLIGLAQLLHAIDPLDTRFQPATEDCIERLAVVADEALMYRPLGSSSMAGGLAIGWASTRRPDLKRKIGHLLLEFNVAFRGEDCIQMANWWHFKLMRVRFRLGSQRPTDNFREAEEEAAKVVSFFQCSAAHAFGPVV